MNKRKLPDEKKIKDIIKKIYGKDGAKYIECAGFARNSGIWNRYGLELKSKPFPNECPDIQHLTAFVEECKNTFGVDCPQTKAYVWYGKNYDAYYIIWEVEKI